MAQRLIRHLVDKETAVLDMVTDYRIQGTALVNGYEKALQERVNSARANHEQERQRLAKVFEEVEADRAMTSKTMGKGRVRDMQVHWEAKQEALKAKIAAAMEAFVE